MTEDEIYEIHLEMMDERREARKLPWEPSRMELATRVATIAYAKGWNEGSKSWRTPV